MLADQHPEDVVTGVGSGRVDQRTHVVPALTLQRDSLVDGSGHVELARAPPLEVVAVGVGHPEQLADHQRRDRQREVLHQIGRRAGSGHGVELLVDDLQDPRLQPFDPSNRELRVSIRRSR